MSNDATQYDIRIGRHVSLRLDEPQGATAVVRIIHEDPRDDRFVFADDPRVRGGAIRLLRGGLSPA